MSADERLRVVYHFPGRLRVRAACWHKAPPADSLLARVQAERGVTSLAASPVTGSLVVEYDAHELQLPRLIATLLDAGGFVGVEVDAGANLPLEPLGQRVRQRMGRVNEALHALTRGNVDLRAGVPGALAGMGAVSFLLGRRRMPNWYDLLFWSFVTFVNLNPPRSDEPHAG